MGLISVGPPSPDLGFSVLSQNVFPGRFLGDLLADLGRLFHHRGGLSRPFFRMFSDRYGRIARLATGPDDERVFDRLQPARLAVLDAERVPHLGIGDAARRGRPDRVGAGVHRGHARPCGQVTAQRCAPRQPDRRGNSGRRRPDRRLASDHAFDLAAGLPHCRRSFAVLDRLGNGVWPANPAPVALGRTGAGRARPQHRSVPARHSA